MYDIVLIYIYIYIVVFGSFTLSISYFSLFSLFFSDSVSSTIPYILLL